MKMPFIKIRLAATSLLVIASSLFAAVPVSALSPPLPAYGADIDRTSVSGLSSGAFMTSQFYLAYSDIMVGAGIVAGGPYLCAKSWSWLPLVWNASSTCMDPLIKSVGPNTPLLVRLTKSLAESGDIDLLENLKDDRLYIFSGREDETVTTVVVDETYAFFTAVGVPETAILYNKQVDAGHALITDNDGDNKCALTEPPFINDCDFEQSTAILKQIYPGLAPPAAKLSGEIIAFDQSEFIDSRYTSMSETAYVYVPPACQTDRSCPIHVVFHGCLQGAEVIGDKYYAQTGYNNVAEANDIIMLYPQVQPSNGDPMNPKGCWDFWGYSSPDASSPDFYSRNAPQLRAVHRMIERLVQPKTDRTAQHED